MIIKERFKKDLKKIINELHDGKFIPDLLIQSVNNDIIWFIEFSKVDDYMTLKWNLMTNFPKKYKYFENFISPEFTFLFENHEEFIDKIIDEFNYYMSFSICACGNYKIGVGYKYCLKCYFTLPFYKNECPVCYERFLDSPDHAYKEKCCNVVLCKTCKKKCKNCIICRS